MWKFILCVLKFIDFLLELQDFMPYLRRPLALCYHKLFPVFSPSILIVWVIILAFILSSMYADIRGNRKEMTASLEPHAKSRTSGLIFWGKCSLHIPSPCIPAAAAAAKSLQSCLTLCDPIDGSLQAPPSVGFSRQEHWSGLPFPSPMKKVKSESEVAQLCPTLATPWTAVYQAPPSMGFSRQEHWSGLPLPSPHVYLGVCK